MTTENTPAEQSNADVTAAAASSTVTKTPEVSKDFIPIPLMFAVCALVILFTVVLMWSNWQFSYTRRQAYVALNNGQYDKAIEKYKELFSEKQSDDDSSDTSSLSKIKPIENPTLLSEVALAYSKKENYEEALKYYMEAQKYGANIPNDDQGNARPAADFSINIGQVYMKMGKLDESEKYLTSALKKNSKDPRANFMMGELEMEKKNFTKAATYFKIVSKDPRYQDKVKDYYQVIEKELFSSVG